MAIVFTFNFDKFLTSVQHLAVQQVPELDKCKAVKLLFLADKYHLARFSRPITGDRYIAMEYGPVGSSSLNLLNDLAKIKKGEGDHGAEILAQAFDLDLAYRYPRLLPKTAPAYSHLSKSDLMALDHVIKRYGSLDFDQLFNLTHGMFAYRTVWKDNPNGGMNFEDFFEEDSDAIEGAKELMIENAAIARAFPPLDEL